MNKYICRYFTPDGFDNVLLISDGEYLSGLYFENEKSSETLEKYNSEFVDSSFLPVFTQTEQWLDLYFNGEIPPFLPHILINAGSDFFHAVIKEVSLIPYGKTLTYGEIAKKIAIEKGKKPSARAVGNAVGKNPLCIIIPCHRVIASNRKIGGYSGGIKNKISLLQLEKIKDIRL